jgi:hypothetical protein
MSKHLLRKLLKLDTELDTEKSHEQSDTEKSSKSKMYIKDNTKEGVYYSTDLGKTVFTRIPKHMKISYETSLPYDDTTEQQDTDITTTEYTQNTNKKTLENTNKMYIKDNTKDALYYSTDKGRSVFTRIPKHMKISYETSLPEQTVQTYTDDLSDVSSNLLKTIIRQQNKDQFGSDPNTKSLIYYSTDKNDYTTATVPSRMNVIPDLQKFKDHSNIYSDGEYTSFNYAKKYPSIYSDIDMSDITSKYSDDFSKQSSFGSEQDTSYNSFFDIYNDYIDKRQGKSPNSDTSSFNIFKESHRQRPQQVERESPDSDTSSFNIFKESHRQRPQVERESPDSDTSSFNIFKESHRQRPQVERESPDSDTSSFNIFKESHRQGSDDKYRYSESTL